MLFYAGRIGRWALLSGDGSFDLTGRVGTDAKFPAVPCMRIRPTRALV
jgi:hypothetical protein